MDAANCRQKGWPEVVDRGRARRIALAQINPTVGDLEGNRQAMERAAARAAKAGADLIVFPELALTGCPLDDLLLRDDFRRAVARELDALAKSIGDLVAVA